MRPFGTYVINSLVAIVASVTMVVAFPAPSVSATADSPSPVPSRYFVRLDVAGNPARWDPCSSLRWKIAGTRPSARLRKATAEAMRQIASTAGLRFVYAGRATKAEFASPPRNTIVIGSSSSLGVANAGGIASLLYEDSTTGTVSIVGARVVINPVVVRTGTRLSRMLRPIVLHEVGHAIGLAHVDDPAEIMYPQVVIRYSYTAAARRALVELGATKGCTGRLTSRS